MASPINIARKCNRESTVNGRLTIFDTSSVDGACPGSESSDGNYRCCQRRDVCLGYGICYSQISFEGGSGFYMSSCTDPTYQSAACLKICSKLREIMSFDEFRSFQNCHPNPHVLQATEALPDVTYDANASLWKCCGTDSSGTVTCGDPTNISFQAPSLEEILKTSSNDTDASETPTSTSVVASNTSTNTSLASTMSTLSTPASATASSTTNAASSAPSSKASTGLSGGTIAGIVVPSVVAVIVLAVLVALLLRRRRKHKAPPVYSQGSQNFVKAQTYEPYTPFVEAPSNNTFRASELPNDTQWQNRGPERRS